MKKKPKSQSQKIRSRLFVIWELKGKPGDFEVYYTAATNKLIKRLDEVIANLGG